MKQHLYIGKEPNFPFIIIASFILHLIFIAVVTVPLKTKESEYKTYFVDLVGPADVRKKAPVSAGAAKGKTGAVESPQATKPQSKADMSLEAIERLAEKKVEKEKVTKEIDRLRAISSLSKLKKEKADERAQGIDVIRQEIQGSASRGQGAAQSIGGDVYYAMIIRKIKNEWVYPEAVSADLEAIISFIMDENGKVVSYKIEQPSGNPLFDRSAVNAVLKASPLPPHPEENEIVVRFHR